MIYCIKMLVDSWDKTQTMNSPIPTAFDLYGQFMIISSIDAKSIPIIAKIQNIWPLDMKLTRISYTVFFRN